MSKRDNLLIKIDQRKTDQHLFAPLVDTLYAASVTGHDWVSDCGIDEQIEAGELCGYHAMYVQGSAPDLWPHPALDLQIELVSSDSEKRVFSQRLRTSEGDLTRLMEDRRREGMTQLDNFIPDSTKLDIADCLSEEIARGDHDQRIREKYGALSKKAHQTGVLEIQLELPYFLYGLPGFADGPLMMYLTDTEKYATSMALAEVALHRISSLLVESGVDFIWIGAPGTELLSPDIYNDLIVPQARKMTDHIHHIGGRVHFHCCGQSQLWVEHGFFNQIGMDLHETLSPPPAGTVEDLGAARRKIDPSIVTRGNIDLGLLLTGTPEQCAESALKVIEQTKGFPHIVGAADAILYGTPIENIRAVNSVCHNVS